MTDTAPRFQLLDTAALLALPDPEWLVDGVLPKGGAVMLYGQPGDGKSFLALDWALSLATGFPMWRGRTLRPGPVCYVYAEGLGGLKRRVRAWCDAQKVDPPDAIRFVGEAPRLLDASDTMELIEAVADAFPGTPPVLVILDTVARCTAGGDENSAESVTRAIANADAIRQWFGACVLLVHHQQKGGDMERGHSAWRGSMDVMLHLTRDDRVLTLKPTKVKDGELFDPINLALWSTHGSCVIMAARAEDLDPPELSTNDRHALEALDRVAPRGGDCTSGEWQTSAQLPVRSFQHARKRLVERGYAEAAGRHRYRITLSGVSAIAVQSMCNAGGASAGNGNGSLDPCLAHALPALAEGGGGHAE